jgi:hypothetical protein
LFGVVVPVKLGDIWNGYAYEGAMAGLEIISWAGQAKIKLFLF